MKTLDQFILLKLTRTRVVILSAQFLNNSLNIPLTVIEFYVNVQAANHQLEAICIM